MAKKQIPDTDIYLPAMRRKNWLSIKKAKNCLFSRRNGYIGKIIFGYSVCFRIFNKDIL